MAAYEPSDELRAAVEAMNRAKTIADDIIRTATKRLHQAVADECAKPTRPADVGRFMGWHAGYVRKIAKAHGVPPYVDVKPPQFREVHDSLTMTDHVEGSVTPAKPAESDDSH